MVNIVCPHIPKDDGKPAHLSEHPRTQAVQIVMDYLTHGLRSSPCPELGCSNSRHFQLPLRRFPALGDTIAEQQPIDRLEIFDEVGLNTIANGIRNFIEIRLVGVRQDDVADGGAFCGDYLFTDAADRQYCAG